MEVCVKIRLISHQKTCWSYWMCKFGAFCLHASTRTNLAPVLALDAGLLTADPNTTSMAINLTRTHDLPTDHCWATHRNILAKSFPWQSAISHRRIFIIATLYGVVTLRPNRALSSGVATEVTVSYWIEAYLFTAIAWPSESRQTASSRKSSVRCDHCSQLPSFRTPFVGTRWSLFVASSGLSQG